MTGADGGSKWFFLFRQWACNFLDAVAPWLKFSMTLYCPALSNRCICCPLFLTACFLSFFLFLPCMFVCRICPSLASPFLFMCFLLCLPLWFSPWLHVDISISLLAVVVGFCGLALLVVSLFVFWKLCWPIWRSKALSAHTENGLHVGFPEAPPPNSPPVNECKVAEVEKKYPPEVKVNGRSSVKLLEAAMKISQTSPDIPAEVQTALREKLSQQAKIQRQTTEPTSSSRYPVWTQCSHITAPSPQSAPENIITVHTHVSVSYYYSWMVGFLSWQFVTLWPLSSR